MTTIIDQLPLPVPSRTDPVNFSVRADNFLGELPDFATQINALATELNTLGAQVEASKTAAQSAETNAQASAFAASGSANNAASSSGAALWVSGTTYSLGALVYSPITGRTYRRKIAGAGTTDPSADATNWIPIVLEISTQYPTIRPSLNLDFVNNKYLDPRITFTRSSTAKYFDGKTVHKAEENLLTYSEQFDNAGWTKNASTITANTVVGPFGASTADTLTETTATNWHGLYEYISSVAGGQYTLSVYAKYNTRQYLQLCLGSNGFNTTYYANFDIQNGMIGTVGAGVTATIDHVGNSWYRCSITGTALSTSLTAGANIIIVPASSSGYASGTTGSTSNSTYIFGAQVEQRSSVGPYQVTTTQPVTNYQSTLVTASVNQPRFDHDPVTKECKGLLIEDATTNLLTYSEDFGNAAWSKTAVTVSGDFTYAPDGTLTADRLIENSAVTGHHVHRAQAWTTGVSYVLSVYAKDAGRRYLRLGMFTNQSNAFSFDLQTGSLTSGLNITSADAKIEGVGNGWYRCSIRITPGASVTGYVSFLLDDDTDPSNTTYTGDGYSGVYIWGAQLESNSASPSSYVDTTATTAARSYDNAVMTGNNFSSWYNQEEGSVYSEFKMDQKPLLSYFSNGVWSINDTTSSNNLYVSASVNSYVRAVNNYAGVATVSNDSPFTWAIGTLYRVGISFSQNDANVTFNSSTVIADTNCTLSKNMRNLQLGATTTGTALLRGHLRRFTYYPKKLTNQELQTLTAI